MNTPTNFACHTIAVTTPEFVGPALVFDYVYEHGTLLASRDNEHTVRLWFDSANVPKHNVPTYWLALWLRALKSDQVMPNGKPSIRRIVGQAVPLRSRAG
jgi:hypothetical protein